MFFTYNNEITDLLVDTLLALLAGCTFSYAKNIVLTTKVT